MLHLLVDSAKMKEPGTVCKKPARNASNYQNISIPSLIKKAQKTSYAS